MTGGLFQPGARSIGRRGLHEAGANRIGGASGPLGLKYAPVFLPAALSFDTASFPITPSIADQPGMRLATGSAGTTPEAMFDLYSTARSAPDITYYIGAGGSDSNNGTTPATKLATVSKAIQLANTGNFKAKYICDGMEFVRNLGPQGTVPLFDCAFTVASGRATMGTFDNFAAFTLDATFTNCYSLTITTDRMVNRLVQSPYKARGVFTNVDYGSTYATPATLNAATLTRDEIVQSGGVTYVRRLDGAVPTTTNSRLYRGSVQLFSFTTAVNIYMENIDLEGGSVDAAFSYLLAAQSVVKRVCVVKNCSAKYAGGSINVNATGFRVTGMQGLAYFYGCEGSANSSDGISGKDPNSSGLFLLTVNCSGTDAGRGTSQSNNGLTGHDDCIALDIAGYYPNNRGGSVRFVNTTKVLCVGTYSSDLGDVSLGGATTPTAFETDNTAVMWCDRTKPDMAAGTKAYLASTGTTIHLRNVHASLGTNNGGGGTVDTY